MARDADFSNDIKERLAKSVGYNCSWPTCPNPTIGPSTESAGATTNVGMACHIVAASTGPGARRVVPGMNAEERAQYANGIWLCYTHGKEVDTDEKRFSVEMLTRWREVAELRARIRLESSGAKKLTPADLLVVNLISNKISLPTVGAENQLIGDAFHDSLVGEIWGDALSDSLRDLAIEAARNAFQYGHATNFTLHITEREVQLLDDGTSFDPLTLHAEEGRGGALALQQFHSLAGVQVVTTYSRANDKNLTRFALIRAARDALDLSPCSLLVERDMLVAPTRVEQLNFCNRVYLVLPQYLSLSDVFMLEQALPTLAPNLQYVLIVSRASQGVRTLLAEKIPNAEIIVAD